MRKILLGLVCLLAATSARAQNTIAVSATHIQGLNGTLLVSGSLCFQGTDQNDRVIAFQVGGGGGGAVVTTPYCTAVTTGAITTFNIPNPANTSPVNIRYRITVLQGARTILLSPGAYLCNTTGACTSPYTFNFDTCFSTGACLASPVPITAGGAGPQGPAGPAGPPGAGVSTASDITWTNNQRTKGPIPWRDITAYMPAGGCSSATSNYDPQTTGTISSSSATLTLANARDFKNGCGIAVIGAGPTATVPTPNQGCSISSISRTGGVATVTCAAAHNLPVGLYDHFEGIQIAGVTDSSFNGTFDITGVADTTHFTYLLAGSASSSGGTASQQFGYAHGATGSTTYNYKVSAVDASGGMSPASAAIAITTGNATLSTTNYNWIYYGVATITAAQIPREWVIYGDKGLGGAFSCVGTSFTDAYVDMGLAMPCPAFAPATPPSSATAQVLNTTISSGGGTTSLTLAATASNTATALNVYHDESSFLTSCVADDLSDRSAAGFPSEVGSYGCYIPAGNYYFNGPMFTDTVNTFGASVYIAGSPFLNIFPWYFSFGNIHIKGLGASGQTATFGHADTTFIHTSASLAAAIVLRGVGSVEISRMSATSNGHVVWTGTTPYGGSPNTYNFDLDEFAVIPGGGGSALVIDDNVIGVWANNSSFIGSSSAAGLSPIWVTGTPWNSGSSGLIYLNNMSTAFRGIRFDIPGGNFGGGGHNSIYATNWVNESLTASDKALIIHDTGPNAPGAANPSLALNEISLRNVNNSDPANGPAAYTVFQELGSTLSISVVNLDEVNSFNGMLSCGPNFTVCNDRPSLQATVSNSGALGGTWGGQIQNSAALYHMELPMLLKLGYSQFGATPPNPAWAQAMPPPNAFSVTGTGAGSLAANTYCMAVEGKDAQATPGLTLPSNTLCQAVGASGSISLQWSQANGSLNQGYSGFRFLWCSTGGSSCIPNSYVPDIGVSGNPVTYTFTSTAGSTGSALNGVSTAYLSWLYWDRGSKSCIFCVGGAGNILWQLGIGDPSPPATSKLSIQGETNITAGVLRFTTAISDQSCGAAAYFLQASSANSHMKVCNNGTLSTIPTGSSIWQGCGSRGLGDGLNAIAAGTYLQFACVNDTGSTITLTAIHCWTDNAGTSTLNAANNAGTGLLTGAVTCNSTKASGGAAGTQSGTTTLANGDAISFTFVADGTSKQTNWVVTGTF